jgi:predicted regulator of Ras-like GTPase activity (Roadblock/LC7/MglB family)
MTKKRKSSKTDLKEEVPEIAIDLSEEEEHSVKQDKVKQEDKKEKSDVEEKFKQSIEKINSRDGVIGYILRNSTSASIDLKDPTKIIDYAVLSSSAFEASEELSKTFELGDVKHSLIKGDSAKLLSFTKGENKVSVFMENEIDHKTVYKDLAE